MVIHNHITKCSKRTKAVSAWVFYLLCWIPPNEISFDDRVATCVPFKLTCILTCIEPMLLDVKKFLLFVILKFDASKLMLIMLLF